MRHIPSLDGLRGVAILMVIAFHYFFFLPFFTFGWCGVDLFFVLSGYLITGRLLATLDRPDYFTTFYRNRILRIFPLYFATLLLFFIAARFFTKSANQPFFEYYFAHWPSYFLFYANWSFIRYGIPKAPYLTHFWSLSIEEQFYLFWPLLIFVLQRTRRLLAILTSLFVAVIVARCICYYLTPGPANPLFFVYNTFFRIDCLIAGAIIALLHRKNRKLPARSFKAIFVAGATALIISFIFISTPEPWHPFFETIGYSLIAIVAACLIQLSVSSPQLFLVKMLTARPLRFIGKISYGLYVIHFIILQLFFPRFYHWIAVWFPTSGTLGAGSTGSTGSNGGTSLLPAFLSAILCLLMTFILACFSYYYVEAPFLRLKRNSALSGKLRETLP